MTYFLSLRGVPEDLFYLQDNTVGKYKSIKMHLMHPFLDISTERLCQHGGKLPGMPSLSQGEKICGKQLISHYRQTEFKATLALNKLISKYN